MQIPRPRLLLFPCTCNSSCPGLSWAAPGAQARVLPSLKARAPQAEAATRAGLAERCRARGAGRAHRCHSLQFARPLRRRRGRREHRVIAPRQSPSHSDARFDDRRPAAVSQRRSVPRQPARGVGTHSARDPLPARCAGTSRWPSTMASSTSKSRRRTCGRSIRGFPSVARAARTPRASKSKSSTSSAPEPGSAPASRLGIDRDSKYLQYADRQLGSTWWSLSTIYSDNSDGRLGELTLEKPFYSLGSRRAGGLSLLDDQRIDARYDTGRDHRPIRDAREARDYLLGESPRVSWMAGRDASPRA